MLGSLIRMKESLFLFYTPNSMSNFHLWQKVHPCERNKSSKNTQRNNIKKAIHIMLKIIPVYKKS